MQNPPNSHQQEESISPRNTKQLFQLYPQNQDLPSKDEEYGVERIENITFEYEIQTFKIKGSLRKDSEMNIMERKEMGMGLACSSLLLLFQHPFSKGKL